MFEPTLCTAGFPIYALRAALLTMPPFFYNALLNVGDYI